jgi:drug/metabolite transporter (DMT)-like permease
VYNLIATNCRLSTLLLVPQVEYFAYHKTVSWSKLCAIALLMFGITVATVSDKQVSSNPLGILVAGLAVLSSSLYQVRCCETVKSTETLPYGKLHD